MCLIAVEDFVWSSAKFQKTINNAKEITGWVVGRWYIVNFRPLLCWIRGSAYGVYISPS